ncbi:hypothetical protein EJ110_NYTH30112 [Nymphaea thermarum]|nr:hypothetical protein EJ110_NYTH30112 [Nymphaea thermarum]
MGGLYRLIIMLYFFLILSFAALCAFALEIQNDQVRVTSSGKYLKIQPTLQQSRSGGRKWLKSKTMVGFKTKTETEKMKQADQMKDGPSKISGKAMKATISYLGGSDSGEGSYFIHKRESTSRSHILRTLSSITSSHHEPPLYYHEFRIRKHRKSASSGSSAIPLHTNPTPSESGIEEEDGSMFNMDYNHCPHHKPPINNAQPRSLRLCRP